MVGSKMNMRKYLLIISLLFILPLSLAAAEDMPRTFTPAVVKMIGTINPRDVEIIVTNEAGAELTADDALMEFDFPALEQWEVSQSLNFYYSSHLAKNKEGRLSFQIDDLEMDEYNALRVGLELYHNNNANTRVDPSGNTFVVTFQEGPQEKTAIGTLTVRIRKSAQDIYSAGTYRGYFSMNYTEMN
jgi:hypothetical protein